MRGLLLVPGQSINLYSIWSATDAGVEFQFAFNTVIFFRNKEIIMEGRRSGKKTVYYLNIKASEGYPQPKVTLNRLQKNVCTHAKPIII
jgi:hypothetical protein